MDVASPQRKKLIALALVVAVYWMGMFAGTHMPVPSTRPHNPNPHDKWHHTAAFAGLAVLLATVGRAAGLRSWRLSVGVVVVVALYGLFDEATQAFVRRREPDLFDWLADMTGALLGLTAFALVVRLWPANRRATSAN